MSTSGWDASAAPAVAPEPVTMLITPGGSPSTDAKTSANLSAICELIDGGLRMQVLPTATAGASLTAVMMVGRFHGVINPTTPTACRWRYDSVSGVGTGIWSPIRRNAAFALHSNLAAAPMQTPKASLCGVPCSSPSIAAISSAFSRIAAAIRKSTLFRSSCGSALQAGKAARAALTALSTSAAPDAGATPISSPVEGFSVLSVAPETAPVNSPFMNILRLSISGISPFLHLIQE